MKNATVRVAIYARVSTSDQETPSRSASSQNTVSAAGWHVVEVFEDEAIAREMGIGVGTRRADAGKGRVIRSKNPHAALSAWTLSTHRHRQHLRH
jgi:hypothetical protein